MKLHGQRQFAAVYAAKTRKNLGPISLMARPNDLPILRLGLSVSRRVGSAVRRNRFKRLIREAFRLTQHDLPAGYDVIVIVHPHDPAALADYRVWLRAGLESLDRQWRRRRPRTLESHDPSA